MVSIINIKDFSKMDVLEFKNYGNNGFKYLENHFSTNILVNKLENILESVIKEKSV